MTGLAERMKSGNKTLFDVWMHEISDNIQRLCVAHGERFSADEHMACIKSAKTDSSIK